jgi:hypothetical protein
MRWRNGKWHLIRPKTVPHPLKLGNRHASADAAGIDQLPVRCVVAEQQRADAVPAGPAVGSLFHYFDGLQRENRIRYDTPVWDGFQFATSLVDGGPFDVAGRFAREYEDFRLAGAIGRDPCPTASRRTRCRHRFTNRREQLVTLAIWVILRLFFVCGGGSSTNHLRIRGASS